MFLTASIFAAAVSVIPLEGVVGSKLSPRADFDAYNVNVGDPMILTVDFIGEADFGALHPPALSEAVDPDVWKVDDKSAKTDTYRDARRITYRVRPVKEGCLEFPSLTFSYRHKSGQTLEASTLPIPVHSRKSSQIALAGLDDFNSALPLPDGIVVDLSSSPWGSSAGLSDDELFAWRKACSRAEASEFKRFDFPEARLNEAACEILAGNWARALSIYLSLEWKIGQTVAIERGIVAAIALKTSNPDAELPMWRRVMRPVLRHSWKGRTLYAVGALLSIGAVFILLRVILRLIVCFAVALVFSQSAFALNPFAEMERMREEMMREMNSMKSLSFSGGGMSVNNVEMSQPKITAKVTADKTRLTVGETFNLIVSLDVPKDCTLSDIRINTSRRLGLTGVGKSENLPDEPGSSDDRVVKRMSIPLRYDIPFKEDVYFYVVGMCERVIRKGNYWSSFSSNFSENAGFLKIEVKNLDGVETPDDYNGCVGEGFTAFQRLNVREVETNDVVSAIVTVRGEGAFIPDNAFLGQIGRDGNSVVFKRLFRADGENKTPDISFSYYNPSKMDFERVTAKGVALKYIIPKEREAKTVVIDAAKGATKTVIRFAPRESAREIASTVKRADELKITETMGEWVRVDDGVHAGWVKRKELK